MDIMKEIETEDELEEVLVRCYKVLGTSHDEIYGYNALLKRLQYGLQPLVYALKKEIIVLPFWEEQRIRKV